MVTVEALKAYGADTDAGLARCMNNEGFYLRLVNMQINDANFERLFKALNEDNAKEAFEAAHALKGALGNLALSPLYESVAELTEKLRGAQEIVDTGELQKRVVDLYEKLKALAQ